MHTWITKTCKRHHVKLEHALSTCYVCEHRSNYMVHGHVEVFDQGFDAGYAGQPNKQSERLACSKKYEQAANYEDGWRIGHQMFLERNKPPRPRKILKGGQHLPKLLYLQCAVPDCDSIARRTALASINNAPKRLIPVCDRHFDAALEDAL